jgi:hypothetical protein
LEPEEESMGRQIRGYVRWARIQRHGLGALVAALLLTPFLVVMGTAPPAGAASATWTVTPSANVGTGNNNILEATSCVSSSWCAAVGFYVPPSPSAQTLAEVGNGSSWSIVPSANTSSSVNNELFGVSCVSTTWCVAVGYAGDGGGTQTLIETWNGASWAIVTSPDASGILNQLSGVSCLSQSNCTAVGQWDNGTNFQTLVETWNGTSWTIVSSPNSGSGFNVLTSVSCTSATFCAAGGWVNVSGSEQPLAQFWNGTAWTLASMPNPPGDQDGVLLGVSCANASFCVAVGEYSTQSGGPALIEMWNGSVWTQSTAPLPASGALVDYLYSVTCQSAASCVAAGDSTIDGTQWPTLVETWNGATWTVNQSPATGATDTDNIYGVSCAGAACVAVGETAPKSGDITTLALSGNLAVGYRFVASDGGIFAFGGAPFYGSMGGKPLNKPMVGLASDPLTGGYWEVASDGGIFNFNAPYDGSMGGQPLNSPVVGMAADVQNGGYWEVAADGGIFAFGGAPFYGSMGGKPLNSPIVGMAADPITGGYWEVASDGGIFNFNAPFLGSMGGQPLNKPVVGMAADPVTGGYWEVASDGGIFTFGAVFQGSMGGQPLNKPVVGIAADPVTGGYWEVAADGGIFNFGAPFLGSMGGQPLNAPIVGMDSFS